MARTLSVHTCTCSGEWGAALLCSSKYRTPGTPLVNYVNMQNRSGNTALHYAAFLADRWSCYVRCVEVPAHGGCRREHLQPSRGNAIRRAVPQAHSLHALQSKTQPPTTGGAATRGGFSRTHRFSLSHLGEILHCGCGANGCRRQLMGVPWRFNPGSGGGEQSNGRGNRIIGGTLVDEHCGEQGWMACAKWPCCHGETLRAISAFVYSGVDVYEPQSNNGDEARRLYDLDQALPSNIWQSTCPATLDRSA